MQGEYDGGEKTYTATQVTTSLFRLCAVPDREDDIDFTVDDLSSLLTTTTAAAAAAAAVPPASSGPPRPVPRRDGTVKDDKFDTSSRGGGGGEEQQQLHQREDSGVKKVCVLVDTVAQYSPGHRAVLRRRQEARFQKKDRRLMQASTSDLYGRLVGEALDGDAGAFFSAGDRQQRGGHRRDVVRNRRRAVRDLGSGHDPELRREGHGAPRGLRAHRREQRRGLDGQRGGEASVPGETRRRCRLSFRGRTGMVSDSADANTVPLRVWRLFARRAVTPAYHSSRLE